MYFMGILMLSLTLHLSEFKFQQARKQLQNLI